MRPCWLLLLATFTVTACAKPPKPDRRPPAVEAAKVEEPGPPAAKTEEPATAPATATVKDVLEIEDFNRVLGIGPGAKEADVKAALGEPSERVEDDEGEITLIYDLDLRVILRPSGGIQIIVSRGAIAAFAARYPADPARSIVDIPRDEAARRLPFMGEIDGYRSCKHYSEDLFLDVTLMCRTTVSTVTVVWEPLPPAIKAEPRPADHCN